MSARKKENRPHAENVGTAQGNMVTSASDNMPELTAKVNTKHVEKLTFLTAATQDAVGKKYALDDGNYKAQHHPHETFWNAESLPVHSLDDAARLIRSRAADPRTIFVHGALAPGVDRKGMRRRKGILAPVEHRLLVIDKDAIGTADMDPEASARAGRDELPAPLRAAACAYQLTASHGVKGARVRLFFWLDRAISLAAMKEWLPKKFGTDPAIWSEAQPVFISAQVEDDPFAGRRWGRLDGSREVKVPDDIAAIKRAVSTYDRPSLAKEGVEIDAPHSVEEWARKTCNRDNANIFERGAFEGRRNSFRLVALDGHDLGVSQETLEPLLALWHSPDDEDAHHEAIARLDDIGADPAIADRLAAAGRAIEWDSGEPLGHDDIVEQIKSAFSSAQNPFGSAYKPEIGERFGAVEDETESFTLIERARTELDIQGQVFGETVFRIIDALRKDGMSQKPSADFGRDIAALRESDNVLGLADDLFDTITAQAREIKWRLENAVSPRALFSIADDIADSFEPMAYSVRGLLPRRGVGFLMGPSHGGKSFAVIDLGGHLATGRDWLGYKIKKPYCVLYVTGEGRDGIDQRLKAWRLRNGGFDGNFAVMENPPNLFLEKEQAEKRIVAAAKALAEATGCECALVILDTVASLCAGMEENSAKEVAELTARMRSIAKKADAAVMGVHHTGLADKTRGRGSTALYGNVDFELLLHVEKNKDGRVLWRAVKNTKNRDGELREAGHRFTLEKVRVGEYADDKEPIYSLVFTAAPPALAVDDDAEDDQDEAPTIPEPARLDDEDGPEKKALVLDAAAKFKVWFSTNDLVDEVQKQAKRKGVRFGRDHIKEIVHDLKQQGRIEENGGKGPAARIRFIDEI